MDEPEGKSAVSTKAVEVVVAVLFLVFGGIVIWDSWRLGARWGSDGPEAGYFPFYIGIILSIGATVNLIRALKGRDIKEQSFVSVESLKMVVAVLLPSLVYVGLIEWLGIYVASVLFIAAFMKWLGKYRWLKTVLVSVGVNVTFFLMFEMWFKVPLPKGPLEAALGLN